MFMVIKRTGNKQFNKKNAQILKYFCTVWCCWSRKMKVFNLRAEFNELESVMVNF